jgi:hypothetical protein
VYLRDLLPKYLFRTPGTKKPIQITSAILLRRVVGFSRTYCYDAWGGKSPMSKKLALRLHTASRGTLPMEKLFVIEPRTWPAEKLAALAASRARTKLQASASQQTGDQVAHDQKPDSAG